MPVSMPVFQRFPVEAEIIGRLVVGYGELELDLFNCVVMGISDFDIKALSKKTIYRSPASKKSL